ncbi:ABC transporter permease [candidate division KSB1 bacterium]
MKKEINKYPNIGDRILRLVSTEYESESYIGDIEEYYKDIVAEKGLLYAKSWYVIQVIRSVITNLLVSFYWSIIMFENYIKISFRNFFKYKLFSFINIFGLAIGIAICMIINLWIQRELNYDSFHSRSDRICRIERELFRDNLYSRWPITGGIYKQALIDEYPEIENATRVWGREFSVISHDNQTYRQGMFAVDNSFLEIFDFDLIEGDKNTALKEPRSVVMTRENAIKYLGTDNVLGKTVSFEQQGNLIDMKVTGIINDVPKNSHIQFDMLMSISSYPETIFNSWRGNNLYTYVLLQDNTDRKVMEEKLKGFVTQHLEPVYVDLLGQGLGIHEVLKMHLFPITDIHLNPAENWELEAGGNIYSVYIFSSIAILILFIACANFINLSTARANKRAKEVGLRKTVGASSSQLRSQFIIESILSAFIAMIISVILIALLIPLFNRVFNETLSVLHILNPQNFLIYLGLAAAVGLLSGLYPAFYMTRFDPVETLKSGTQSGMGKSIFRRNMVVIQFAISITLIIGMLTVYKQMNFIQNKSLGFDKENVVILPIRSTQVRTGYENFRNNLLTESRVISVSASSDVPIESNFSNTSFFNRENPNDFINLIVMSVDYDYVDTYKMELLAGRGFSRDFSTDTVGTLLINSAAAKRIGWSPEEAAGNELSLGDPINPGRKIVGVLNNFNFRSLRSEVEPLAILFSESNARAISIRITQGNLNDAVETIRQRWKTEFPDEQFDYFFLDSTLDQLYNNEIRMQNIFIVFSCFSILVACLGLFGLAAFTAETRTKEIGIRKVLGASSKNVIFLLSKEFTKWVVLANIIAWPAGWYIMNKWLQNFAYKTDMGFFVYILACVMTLGIAVFTFSFQSFKAARSNPVDSLKYE